MCLVLFLNICIVRRKIWSLFLGQMHLTKFHWKLPIAHIARNGHLFSSFFILESYSDDICADRRRFAINVFCEFFFYFVSPMLISVSPPGYNYLDDK